MSLEGQFVHDSSNLLSRHTRVSWAFIPKTRRRLEGFLLRGNRLWTRTRLKICHLHIIFSVSRQSDEHETHRHRTWLLAEIRGKLFISLSILFYEGYRWGDNRLRVQFARNLEFNFSNWSLSPICNLTDYPLLDFKPEVQTVPLNLNSDLFQRPNPMIKKYVFSASRTRRFVSVGGTYTCACRRKNASVTIVSKLKAC